MIRTRKIQVTLKEEEYEKLARIARRKGQKLAAVVRESIRKYELEPETTRARRQALETLLTLPPVAVPQRYEDWEEEYGALKTDRKKKAE